MYYTYLTDFYENQNLNYEPQQHFGREVRYNKLSYAIKSNLITLLRLITLVYKSYNFTVKSLPEKTNKSEPAIAIVLSSPVQLSQVVAASSQSR